MTSLLPTASVTIYTNTSVGVAQSAGKMQSHCISKACKV